MSSVRPPAVAGMFYPGEPDTLARTVRSLLSEASEHFRAEKWKVLVAPHAGYIYSGSTAAAGYASVDFSGIQRIVITCPTHRVGIRGIATAGADAFETPVGVSRVDTAAVSQLEELSQVVRRPDVHAFEHAIEVQLPFLQQVASNAKIVPLAVGECDPEKVAEVLDAVWGGNETLVLISSDLSHYLPYDQARAIDADTIARICSFRQLDERTACGIRALNGVAITGARRKMTAKLVASCNSGDTAGDKSRVVGYASIVMR